MKSKNFFINELNKLNDSINYQQNRKKRNYKTLNFLKLRKKYLTQLIKAYADYYGSTYCVPVEIEDYNEITKELRLYEKFIESNKEITEQFQHFLINETINKRSK